MEGRELKLEASRNPAARTCVLPVQAVGYFLGVQNTGFLIEGSDDAEESEVQKKDG